MIPEAAIPEAALRPGPQAAAEGQPAWETFVRALIETLDAHMPPEERALLLRAIGGRIAALSPLPPEATLSVLEARMNERLAEPRWGQVALSLDPEGPALVLRHERLPVLPTPGDGEGGWILPVLEGLHGGWIAAQPGAEPSVPARLVSHGRGGAVLRYGA
ncbi:cellulose biosynthesis protein BcsD [Muricoccus nepalensis]|uniref:cellulose biosynthesis protein BcsD n=1 Tax=Muricoccus nepalensis TaxID=1854500 RepID=UPI0013875A54|nr:cellulose biosynthesis protein BcsD [Roseomonas nepalensis]